MTSVLWTEKSVLHWENAEATYHQLYRIQNDKASLLANACITTYFLPRVKSKKRFVPLKTW